MAGRADDALIAALLAAVLVGAAQLLGWRGVDVAAQVYRVDAFRHSGFTLWDFQWYGGHWTLNYSVIYPPLAAGLSVPGLTVLSAGLAALAFDRLVRPHFPAGGRAASLVFAAGTLVPAAIGQLPFLAGAALGLTALWVASRRAYAPAALLAGAAALTSPLAGAFVALAAAAWAIRDWRDTDLEGFPVGAASLGTAAAGPVIALAVLFPGQGSMPYPFVDYLWELTIAVALWALAGRGEPAIRAGCVLFAALATFSVAVPTPLGGNVGRLEDIVALPLCVGAIWARRRVLLAAAAVVPLVLSQWGPAWSAVAGASSQASTGRAFFAPLDGELARLAGSGPAGRVEVVPTEYHWEAAYVAPVMPLARGWERQLDVADNPLFYETDALTATAYRAWLLDNGVRFVALPAAPLDMAGRAEALLVSSGTVPGLVPVWHSRSWRLFSVDGSTGIVSSPARLVSVGDGKLVVRTGAPGAVLIRVRFSPDWTIDGAGCLTRTDQSWIMVTVPRAEQFSLELSLFGSGSSSCSQRLEASAPRAPVTARTASAGPSTHMLKRTNGALR